MQFDGVLQQEERIPHHNYLAPRVLVLCQLVSEALGVVLLQRQDTQHRLLLGQPFKQVFLHVHVGRTLHQLAEVEGISERAPLLYEPHRQVSAFARVLIFLGPVLHRLRKHLTKRASVLRRHRNCILLALRRYCKIETLCLQKLTLIYCGGCRNLKTAARLDAFGRKRLFDFIRLF